MKTTFSQSVLSDYRAAVVGFASGRIDAATLAATAQAAGRFGELVDADVSTAAQRLNQFKRLKAMPQGPEARAVVKRMALVCELKQSCDPATIQRAQDAGEAVSAAERRLSEIRKELRLLDFAQRELVALVDAFGEPPAPGQSQAAGYTIRERASEADALSAWSRIKTVRGRVAKIPALEDEAARIDATLPELREKATEARMAVIEPASFRLSEPTKPRRPHAAEPSTAAMML